MYAALTEALTEALTGATGPESLQRNYSIITEGSMSEIFSEWCCVRALPQMMITGVTRQLTSSCRVQDRKLISDPAEPLCRLDIRIGFEAQ